MLKRFGVVITFRRLLNYSQSLRDSFVGTLSTIFLGDIGFPSTTTSYDEFLDNLSLCCLIWPTFWGFSFSKARPLIFHFLCLNFFFFLFWKKSLTTDLTFTEYCIIWLIKEWNMSKVHKVLKVHNEFFDVIHIWFLSDWFHFVIINWKKVII